MEWIDVKERPLFTVDEKGNWECTEDGNKEFFAAVPYLDKRQPGKTLYWIRYCVVEDGRGLCVIGDEENEKAGWELSDVTHYIPFALPQPPNQ